MCRGARRAHITALEKVELPTQVEAQLAHLAALDVSPPADNTLQEQKLVEIVQKQEAINMRLSVLVEEAIPQLWWGHVNRAVAQAGAPAIHTGASRRELHGPGYGQ